MLVVNTLFFVVRCGKILKTGGNKMYYEKRFGGYSKTVTLDSKQSKKLIMVMFSVIGLVVMLVGEYF